MTGKAPLPPQSQATHGCALSPPLPPPQPTDCRAPSVCLPCAPSTSSVVVFYSPPSLAGSHLIFLLTLTFLPQQQQNYSMHFLQLLSGVGSRITSHLSPCFRSYVAPNSSLLDLGTGGKASGEVEAGQLRQGFRPEVVRDMGRRHRLPIRCWWGCCRLAPGWCSGMGGGMAPNCGCGYTYGGGVDWGEEP